MQVKMKKEFRCACPITSTLDIIGDKWTLVIVKQMLLEGKRTFKDFSESDEAIATNILSSRLKALVEYGVLEKVKMPKNKKTNVYLLTDKGIDLAPLILELTIWGDTYLKDINPRIPDDPRIAEAQKNKLESVAFVQNSYRESIKVFQ